jgi:TonB-dependent receptor
MKTPFLRTILALVFLLITSALFAQETIRGTVTDSTTSKPLIGANVYLAGTALGSATDLEGQFRIDRVPVGSYTLKISYLGYKTKEVAITVQVDQPVVVKTELMIDFVEAEAIVVTGQAEGQAAAINQQLTANTIVNIVSEEKIQELPDANAAESIGRLPGVSIIRSGGEANRVILRGLDARFTNVTIDGVKIAPTDATSRGVDLSTLSQSSLAGIELYKAITPDQDGDALAGSINLVTKKAPEIRELRADLKGDYNRLTRSADQYDIALRFGERFFNNFLGVQLVGNIERRIRSNERIDVDYGDLQFVNSHINNFYIEFTDEIRNRDGLSVLLDMNTPDGGSIRINNVFGKTQRDFLLSSRDYPTRGGGRVSGQSGNPGYYYRDREQEISTLNSSIHGDNDLLGLNLEWGLSYGRSKSEFPFDFEAQFVEPSGMLNPPTDIDTNPGQLINFAANNFPQATLFWTYSRAQENSDKERTAFLDIAKQYLLGNSVSGMIKVGGKYKNKDRSNLRSEDLTPYYTGQWQPFELLPDGTRRPKNFTGSAFENYFSPYYEGLVPIQDVLYISLEQFFSFPGSRNIYGDFRLNPLIDRDRLRQWHELNRNGISAVGSELEVWENPLIRFDDHEVTERVGAGYIMNTLNFGQNVTVIGGLRIEKEDNDYVSNFMTGFVGGFPVTANTIRDTTSSASQTVLLPNLNVAISPTDFMKVRVAAYKALARPDFNMRLERHIAGRPAEVGSQLEVYVGNPNLKTARAWNFEANTSFFGNAIGLVSVSAYYKEIEDMFHMLNDFNTAGDSLLRYFGIQWPSPTRTGPYDLTLPYNSPKPAKVWGFEFEHQMNFRFLPGLLRNFVLSYNASIVRSESIIFGSETVTVIDTTGPIPLPRSRNVLVERTQKLEGMPEFFGNIALGYDIGRFSGRVSVFHQGEHNISYSANGETDLITNAFTRVDLALKQGITNNLAFFLNISNLTNIEDGSAIDNVDVEDGQFHRRLFNQSEQYGLTADFGITLTF